MPGWFRRQYFTPQRATAIARKNRYLNLLERERDAARVARLNRLKLRFVEDPRVADVANFRRSVERLSPVPSLEVGLTRLARVEGRGARPPRALIAAVLSQFREEDFSDQAKRQTYRRLRQMQLQSEAAARRRGRKNVSVSGADKRRFDPTGKQHARTIHGALARLAPSAAWLQVFKNPGLVIPCVQRKIRREVMFAELKAGKGYRSPKRRTWASGVPC